MAMLHAWANVLRVSNAVPIDVRGGELLACLLAEHAAQREQVATLTRERDEARTQVADVKATATRNFELLIAGHACQFSSFGRDLRPVLRRLVRIGLDGCVGRTTVNGRRISHGS
jgi:hypothetical protein